MIQPLGAILTIIAIWLYACGRGNGLVPWVGVTGMVLLLIPPVRAAF
jgi:hypothetical protein